MKLHLLGTGNGGALKCYNTCFCIENDGGYLLVDGGGGNQILSQLKKADIELAKIHNIFVSHNHIDHILGVLWVIRQTYINISDGKYIGNCNIYASTDTISAIKQLREVVFGKVDYDVSEGINFITVSDGEHAEICGMQITFFNTFAAKDTQFGFSISHKSNDNFLVFSGDEPLVTKLFSKFKDCHWLLHEAFCLDSQKQLYDPYTKGHCTVRDAAITAKSIGAEKLVILHSKDNKVPSEYVAEANKTFSGKVFAPADLDVINLD